MFKYFFLGTECKLLQFVFLIEVLKTFFIISLEISCYLVYFKFIQRPDTGLILKVYNINSLQL